jgi:hypothetical protein
MTNDGIVPYGRSFDEYSVMFALEPSRVPGPILGVGDGPSNFNAEATRRQWKVTSIDPVYSLALPDLELVCHAAIDRMIQAVSMVPSHWTWDHHADTAALRAHRLATATDFFSDYDDGRTAGRYVCASLPVLPFETGAFELVLCSHVLFSWADALNLEFHLASVREMLRVASEVRIFPTGRNLSQGRSKYAEAVIALANEMGCETRLEPLSERHRGANAERLVIRRAERRPLVAGT